MLPLPGISSRVQIRGIWRPSPQRESGEGEDERQKSWRKTLVEKNQRDGEDKKCMERMTSIAKL